MIQKITLLMLLSWILTGCATAPQQSKDFSAYQANMPKSILVLPPINNTPDVKATYGYWSTVSLPIAEAGYYVFPVAIVDRMFKENGVTNGNDAQSIAPQKLQEIFGADAGLYIKVSEYGTKYNILDSVSTVTAEANLVDLKTGQLLWTGKETATQSSNQGNSNLIVMLVTAVVSQVANSLNDRAHPLSSVVNYQLFSPTPARRTGLLFGPRSPQFQTTN